MKRILFSGFLLIFFTLLSCGNEIDMVKEHTPDNYPSLTFEKLINSYDYTKNIKWETFETKRDEKMVQVSFEINTPNIKYYSRLYEVYPFVVQFKMNHSNDDFSFQYAGWTLKPKNKIISKFMGLKTEIKYSYSETCNFLYKNEDKFRFNILSYLKNKCDKAISKGLTSDNIKALDEIFELFPEIQDTLNVKHQYLSDYYKKIYSFRILTMLLNGGPKLLEKYEIMERFQENLLPLEFLYKRGFSAKVEDIKIYTENVYFWFIALDKRISVKKELISKLWNLKIDNEKWDPNYYKYTKDEYREKFLPVFNNNILKMDFSDDDRNLIEKVMNVGKKSHPKIKEITTELHKIILKYEGKNGK